MLPTRNALLILCAGLLSACSRQPAEAPAKANPVEEVWYGEVLGQVKDLRTKATRLLQEGKKDEAAAALKNAEPLVRRLLTVPSPTLEAAVAASDIDQLYARMLAGNRHYGWARMVFQKDAARWRNWTPQTEESLRRRKMAEAGMAECDRAIAKQ
jgi:hypothetical protein